MIICCLFYSAWWYVAYHPNLTGSVFNGKAGIFFGLTVLFGIVGVYLNIYGIRHLPDSNWAFKIFLMGCAIYLILLAVTFLVFNRPVTAELLLIVAWTTLETAVIFSAFHDDILNGQLPINSFAVVAIATIISMTAYLLYYKVEEMTAFYLGIVPLITDAIGAAIISVSISVKF